MSYGHEGKLTWCFLCQRRKEDGDPAGRGHEAPRELGEKTAPLGGLERNALGLPGGVVLDLCPSDLMVPVRSTLYANLS